MVEPPPLPGAVLRRGAPGKRRGAGRRASWLPPAPATCTASGAARARRGAERAPPPREGRLPAAADAPSPALAPRRGGPSGPTEAEAP
eukprot:8017781-Lingulodinium_polyedra.AAC.1